MEYKDFGDYLSKARKNKGISQEELANKLNLSRQAISNWETNKCMPDVSIISKLCAILEINMYDFFESQKGIKLIDFEKEKNNKKTKKIILILSIIILVLITTIIFFALNKNEIVYYKVTINDKYFNLSNAHFIETNNLYYLNLGKLNNNIEKPFIIKLFTYKNNKKQIILETIYKDNIEIKEQKGYNEYFEKNENILNNLYIEIEYIVNKETIEVPIKLNFIKEFENTKIFNIKPKEIGNDNNKYIENIILDIKKIKNNNYKYDETTGNYVKKVQEKEYIILPNSNVFIITYKIDNITYYIEYNNTLNSIYINKYNEELKQQILDVQYFIDNENIIYEKGNENIEKYKKMMLEELEKIATKK